MNLLQCEHASFGYERIPVVRNVDLAFESGSILGIVGTNGSGKTTLLRGILGMASLLGGSFHLDPALMPGDIGWLPQQTAAQKDFPASVFEIVLSGCIGKLGWRPFYNKKEKRLAMDTLELTGTADLAQRCFRELSGGQQRRVLLARALCAGRRLLILDEPAAGLDPLAEQNLYNILCRANSTDGTSIIIVTHNISAALPICTHVLHLAGQPLFYGKVTDYVCSKAAKEFSEDTQK